MKYPLSLAVLLLCSSLMASAQPADQVLRTQPAAVTPTPQAEQAPSPATSSAAANPQGVSDKVLSTTALNQAVTQRFEQRFPGIQVTAIRVTPMEGIFEVQVGMDLLYTDAQVNYVLQGSLIDAQARRDLTAERLQTLQQVAFDSLPLERAIRQVKGTGDRKLAVFEDPNCGYCKQFHQTLESVDNVTVYTFLFPILSPDSTTKARDIWCAADPALAWKAWMIEGQVPESAECETPLQANLDLGRQLNVQGTPALFFADGSRVNGSLPLEALKEKLDALGS